MKTRSDNPPVRGTIARYLRGFRLLSRAVPGLTRSIVLHSIVAALLPYTTIWTMSQVLTALETSSSHVWTHAWIALGVGAGMMLLDAIVRRVKEAKWDMLYHGAERLLADAMLAMDHTTAEDPSTANALARAKESMNALGYGLVRLPDVLQNLMWGTVGVSAFIVSLHGLFSTDGWTGASCLIALAAAMLLSWWMSSRFEQLHKRYTDEVVRLDRRYYAFYETVFDPNQAADMRLYRQDRHVVQQLEETECRSFQKHGYKYKRTHGVCGWLHALSTAPYMLWIGVTCALAVRALHDGNGDLGTLFQIVAASVWVVRDAERWLWGMTHALSNAVHLERLYQFLDIPPRMYRGSLTTEKRSDREYTLEVKGVSFRYPSATQDALSDITVRLDSGRRIAIVGENGSGKSTFIKLLSRLYDPKNGVILLNGIDIRKYRYEEYSALLSVVFQDYCLLSRSVAENVACAVDYDAERVKECLRAVGLEAYGAVRLSEDPPSEADAQQIAVARALYKDAPFLLLDEPTASLDPIAEAEMFDALDRIIGDRTALYVSHRLSACRFCDEVWVFDKGRLIQRGSHDELVADQDGQYYRLWRAQAQYYM